MTAAHGRNSSGWRVVYSWQENVMPARTRGPFLLVLPLLGACATGCAIDIRADEFSAREEKRFVVDATTPPEVELVTFDGGVEVRGWDRAEVRVTIEKTAVTKEIVDAIVVKSSQAGNRIHVEAVPASSGDWAASLVNRTSHHARLIASVPTACRLIVRTGDGTVKVEGVTGRVDLDTDDGSVRGVALGGDVRVRTGDGSIKLDTVEGRVAADTRDGSIVVAGQLQGLTATTGDGSIVVRLEPGSRLDSDIDIATTDGGVSVHLPPSFSAELDAATGDGVVRAEPGLGLGAPEKPTPALRGRIGGGGRLMKIRSGDGSITIRQ